MPTSRFLACPATVSGKRHRAQLVERPSSSSEVTRCAPTSRRSMRYELHPFPVRLARGRASGARQTPTARHTTRASADRPCVKRIFLVTLAGAAIIVLARRGLHTGELRAEPASLATPSPSAAPTLAAPLSSAAAPPAARPGVNAAAAFVEHFVDEDAYIVRGSRAKSQAIFFGGQCAQSQFYIEAIKVAAARHTQLVALQGDAACNGAFRGWSFDLPALSRRIDRTFAALGLGAPHDVLLIGYSQGALVAERLASREPTKFTRLVLMASPKPLVPEHFAKASAVVTMAGTLDRQDLMSRGAVALVRAGIRARYIPLPGAAHGYVGTDPEGTFEDVFTWLEEPGDAGR